MPLKRFNKEPSAVDIRGLQLPEASAKPELAFDPENEISDADWKDILDYLRETYKQSRALFYESCTLIYFTLPHHFSQLKEIFYVDFSYHEFLFNLWKDPLIIDLVKKALFAIEDPQFKQLSVGEAHSRWLDNSTNSWLIFAKRGLYLWYLAPERRKEIAAGIDAFLDNDEIPLLKNPRDFDLWMYNNAMAVVAKVFFPERYVAGTYVMDLDKIQRFIQVPRKDVTTGISWGEVLQQLLFLKILSMQEVIATVKGFVEGASKEAEQIGADIPEQPKTLNI